MRGGAVNSYLPANTHQGQSHPWQMSLRRLRLVRHLGVAKPRCVTDGESLFVGRLADRTLIATEGYL
jgi:hypothetical protein